MTNRKKSRKINLDEQNKSSPKKKRAKTKRSFKGSKKNSMSVEKFGTRKKSKPILNIISKNMRRDSVVLNNPNEFYQGLFSNIIKKKGVK